MDWTVIRYICFLPVLAYASVLDVTTRIIPNRIYILLILTGLIGFNLSSLTGLLITGVPLCITAALQKSFGGGDVKFGTLCGFVLKGTSGLMALGIGSILCLLTIPIARKIMKLPAKGTRIPLVPFFSVGCVITCVILRFF